MNRLPRFAVQAFACAASLLALTGAHATNTSNPVVQWSTSAGGNGHYYQFVSGDFSWQQALDKAAAATYMGLQGYLVTVTSAAENSFVSQTLAKGATAWASGSDLGSEGKWTWRAGPEKGQALSYANWAPGEPNNYGKGENYLQLNWTSSGKWNDLNGFGDGCDPIGYIVEFNAAPIPEPTTAALMLGGLAMLGTAARRRRQQKG